MSKLEEFVNICKPIYAFVHKYFDTENLDQVLFEDEPLTTLKTTEIVSIIEKAMSLMPALDYELKYENDIDDLWAHKELLLKGLVILTHVPAFLSDIYNENLVEKTVSLRDELIGVFTNKISEDPQVVEAIKEGRLEEEIEKRKDVLFNFKPLIGSDQTMVINPEGISFQKIPDNF